MYTDNFDNTNDNTVHAEEWDKCQKELLQKPGTKGGPALP